MRLQSRSSAFAHHPFIAPRQMHNWVIDGCELTSRTARRFRAGQQLMKLHQIVWPGNTDVQPTDVIADRDAARGAHESRIRSILTALAITLAVFGPFVIGYTARRYLAHVKYVRKVYHEHEERLHKQLRDAIATTHEMKFPATLLAARDFLKLGTLKSHEELRDRGLLCVRATRTFTSIAHMPSHSF